MTTSTNRMTEVVNMYNTWVFKIDQDQFPKYIGTAWVLVNDEPTSLIDSINMAKGFNTSEQMMTLGFTAVSIPENEDIQAGQSVDLANVLS